MGGQKNTNYIWTPTKRRGPIAAEFSTPGPAAIVLPSTFGTKVAVKARSPAFTISGRHENKSNSASPGPGQYNINGLSHKGKDDVHAPSMHIRPKEVKTFVTPAPGDYNPEKSFSVLEPSPKFSFGIKANSEPPSNVPAPNSYTVPHLLGGSKAWGAYSSSPSFTLTGRPRPVEDKMKIPGPGSYNEAQIEKYKIIKSPAFSMGLKTTIPSDDTQKPGPGAHCPEKYNPDNCPKWTLTPRPHDPERNYVPGPGTYEIGNVDITFERQPEFTMGHRTELPADKTPRPSPNTYHPEKYDPNTSPKWTITSRPRDPEESYVPGPGTYDSGNFDLILEKLPAFTMSPKTELPSDKTPKPAPNAYNTEKYNPDDGPKWSMSPRPKDLKKPYVPGPGAYEAGDLNYFLDKQPIFTMSPKTDLPMDKTPKPAPNAYSPEKVALHKTPEFSFGIRHSPYAGTLRDQ